MSARESIENLWDRATPVGPLLDAYRAELTAEFVAWLVKKAREHRAKGPQYAKQADVIGMLADKASRGAVRPDNLLSLPPQGGPEDVPALLAEVDRLRDELSPYLSLELGTPEGRVSAKCEDATHPVWLRDLDDLRGCPWCRVAELEALTPAQYQDCQVCGAGYEYGQPCAGCQFKKLMADAHPSRLAPMAPDPLTYGPTGYRCGCGKDAHSNLTPCQPMTADEWNARYPVGTPVTAYPGTRDDEPLVTVTRSRAWALGHGAAVVAVDGYSGGICLTHVDPRPGASS